MNLTLRIFFGIVDLIFLVVILNMLKKKKLNLKYTLTWLFAAFALLVVDCFPQIIEGIMNLVGVASPSVWYSCWKPYLCLSFCYL